MTKILLAGEIMAEKQYVMDKIPSAKEVGMVSAVNYLTSSKIINAGRILAVGNKVSIFGCIGDDTDGDSAIKDLKKYGITSSLVYRTSKDSTGQVLVLTNKEGQSGFIVHLSAVKHFDESKLESLNLFEWVYMASSMELSQLYKMIDRAHKEGVRVFLDFPNQQKEFDKTTLRTVDFVVPNRQEVEKLLDLKIETINDALEAITRLKSYTDGNAVITLDKDGAVVFGKDWKEPQHYSTGQAKVVDETGSGDIFRGILLHKYIQSLDIEESVKTALQLATESVKYSGVNKSIETIKEQLI